MIPTLQLTWHLKKKVSQKESSLPTHPFQGQAVSFRQSNRFWVVVKVILNYADKKKLQINNITQVEPKKWHFCVFGLDFHQFFTNKVLKSNAPEKKGVKQMHASQNQEP